MVDAMLLRTVARPVAQITWVAQSSEASLAPTLAPQFWPTNPLAVSPSGVAKSALPSAIREAPLQTDLRDLRPPVGTCDTPSKGARRVRSRAAAAVPCSSAGWAG